MTPKITIYHEGADEFARLIAARAPDLSPLLARDPGELVPHLPQTEVLICGPMPMTPVAGAPRLQWIQTTSAGVENLLAVRDAIAHLAVTNARGIHANLMSDHAIAAMVMLQWDFPGLLRNQANRVWERAPRYPMAGHTLGVVGSGAIGAEVGRRAAEMGMTVHGVRRSAGVAPPGFSRMFPPEELNTLLPFCDFVCVVVPATPQTDGMFGTEQFRAMKSSAFFLNISRGSVMDETALIAALRDGEIAGAALDVFAKEPPDRDNPLWGMPNVIMTPHISGLAFHNDSQIVDLFLDNLARWRADKPLRNTVDLHRGY